MPWAGREPRGFPRVSGDEPIGIGKAVTSVKVFPA